MSPQAFPGIIFLVAADKRSICKAPRSSSDAEAGKVFEAEARGVDGHAEGAIDAERDQLLNFREAGNATGGSQLMLGGSPQAPEPIEVRALKGAFLIDVRAQESGAKGLELAKHLFGS